jgi:hypothetical protein
MGDAKGYAPVIVTIANKGATIEQEVQLRLHALFESSEPPEPTIVCRVLIRSTGKKSGDRVAGNERFLDKLGMTWGGWSVAELR